MYKSFSPGKSNSYSHPNVSTLLHNKINHDLGSLDTGQRERSVRHIPTTESLTAPKRSISVKTDGSLKKRVIVACVGRSALGIIAGVASLKEAVAVGKKCLPSAP